MAQAKAGASDSTDAEIVRGSVPTAPGGKTEGDPASATSQTTQTAADPQAGITTTEKIESGPTQSGIGTAASSPPQLLPSLGSSSDGGSSAPSQGTASGKPSAIMGSSGSMVQAGVGLAGNHLAISRTSDPDIALQHFKSDLSGIGTLLNNASHYASLPVIEIEKLFASALAALSVIKGKL